VLGIVSQGRPHIGMTVLARGGDERKDMPCPLHIGFLDFPVTNFCTTPAAECSGRDVNVRIWQSTCNQRRPQKTIAPLSASLLSPVLARIWNTPGLVRMRR